VRIEKLEFQPCVKKMITNKIQGEKWPQNGSKLHPILESCPTLKKTHNQMSKCKLKYI